MRAALFYAFTFALCLLPFASCLLPSSFSGLLREDALVDALRVADDDELEVAHVGVCDALHVGGRDGAQAFEDSGGVAPAASDEFVLRQLAGLRCVGLLPLVVARQELLRRRPDLV